ncbi:MAG TPA: 3-hydroxyacyl-CoA dehydrogenase family protein [Solirubrobacteraceae bacterium]|nr:3-hydroxyacyl-CoA dehydrogenase family protein [Solirubrobacteraceae bacterium]
MDGLGERLGIAGSGAIACGVAAVAAARGPVLLWARSESSAGRARGVIDKLCARMPDDVDPANVRVVTDRDALGEASFVVEAIAEELGAKCELLGLLDGELAGGAILASTTSSLSVEVLGLASGRPAHFCGLHVFNPVTRMALVELAFPTAATDDTRTRALALCGALGKTAVAVPDVAGFVVNRLLFPYLFDAVRLLEQTGMPAADIDDCMRLGAGHPMGPLALLDLVGLDVSLAIGLAIDADVPQLVRDLVAGGALGRKSRRGFHVYA